MKIRKRVLFNYPCISVKYLKTDQNILGVTTEDGKICIIDALSPPINNSNQILQIKEMNFKASNNIFHLDESEIIEPKCPII